MNSKAIQNEQEEKKKPEVQTTNGFPKVQNNPIQSNIPTHQVPQQIAPHTQHIVEAKQVIRNHVCVYFQFQSTYLLFVYFRYQYK